MTGKYGLHLVLLSIVCDKGYHILSIREAKLRKAEEQLRIKEKSIQELNNEKILLGTR
jgi:hypothetical protein